ncbi:poly polymerase catalytic domain-containing protein [Fimicolochytrium jonesii]|uniref:poly polymerase catalytic domain-containing protein n=1 Tax=Fimicolochytrium jonesii TaxID=1396493 RepID=UPI0022FEFCE2|nr:poly polymerase catalytic domain-containing protein [Fimicolochytrium jonesii]KAI8824810.1 poly polymerase catalytic domain-containing protein [Fimicolochytrium jonesii]
MTKTDVDKGHYGLNVFYKMQVVYNRVQDIHILWTRWGGIGEDGMYQRTPMSTKEACVEEFCKIFKAKSGNSWEDRGPEAFVPKQGKYIPVRPRKEPDVEIHSLDVSDSPASKLSDELQDVMRIITDVKGLKREMAEDKVALPLGNIERTTVLQAYRTLCEIRDKVKALDTLRTASAIPDVKAMKSARRDIADLSNTYFTLLPSTHDGRSGGTTALLSMYEVNAQMEKMADLLYLGTACDTLLAAHGRRKEVNPWDYVAAALKCKLKPVLDRESDEFRMVREYMEDTSAGYDIVSLIDVERGGEKERFAPHANNENRKLLWHGSNTGNFMGILSEGLKVAPVEAASTGYMFGKGIYFADTFCKSVNYSSVGSGVSCLLLCEVALGKPKELENQEYMEHPAEGTQSTLGLGQEGPSGQCFIAKDGTRVPRGPIIKYPLRTKADGTPIPRYLARNEYIVYDPAQVRIRYMLIVRPKEQCVLCEENDAGVEPIGKHADSYKDVVKNYDLPSGTFANNKYERAIVRGLLYAKKTDVKQVWTDRLPTVLRQKTYGK